MAQLLMDRQIPPQKSSWQAKCAAYSTAYLRVSLGAGFLSAVADRFGIWGQPGARTLLHGETSRISCGTQRY